MVGCFKQTLVGAWKTSAENNAKCSCLAHKVSEGNNISNLCAHFRAILAKKVGIFCPFPKNSHKAKIEKVEWELYPGNCCMCLDIDPPMTCFS